MPSLASPNTPATSPPRAASFGNELPSNNRFLTYGFIGLIVAGVFLRLLVVILAGNRINAPWGGTGDAPAYVLLAHNIATGKGYAYAGYPTAYRAPAYPLLLAGMIRLFGNHALIAMRGLQFLIGLAIAAICSRVAASVWGKLAGQATFLIALFFPTLVVMTGEVLTETTATLCSAIFILLLTMFLERPRWVLLVALSATVGIATLVHFNMALFGFVVLWAILRQTQLSRWRAVTLAVVLPAVLISPWLIRNFVVFQGALLLSTESGPTAAMGVLAPQGRALPGDSERLISALGWLPPADLETNGASRSRLGQESDLNRKAWGTTFTLWRRAGWGLIPLTFSKLSYFWLSTDQLAWTQSFRTVVRVARATGVVAYWVLLALAVYGWFDMRVRRPELARIFLFYAILVTVLHVPFNMNTRLRMPFIDPWLTVLAGATIVSLTSGIQNRLVPDFAKDLQQAAGSAETR